MKRRAGITKLNRHETLAVMKDALETLSRGGEGWLVVEENERAMRRAQQAMRAASRDEKILALWNEVRHRWQEAQESVTPHGFWDDFQKLKARDASALESGIAFLEADPWFFRSGYIKEWLTTFIRRLPLSTEQEKRLRRVVLHIAKTRGGREFRYFCRLARRVANAELCQELQELSHSDDANVRRRATWMLDYCHE